MPARYKEAPVQTPKTLTDSQTFTIDGKNFYIDRYDHVNHESYPRKFIEIMRELPVDLSGFGISRLSVRYGAQFREGEVATVVTDLYETDVTHKIFEQKMVKPGTEPNVAQRTIWTLQESPGAQAQDIRTGYPKQHAISTRESDLTIPGAGILDYSDYCLILENERLAALSEIDVTLESLRSDHKSLIFLTEFDTSFADPLSGGESVGVTTEIHKLGRIRIVFVQEMGRDTSRQKVLQISTCVFVDHETRKVKPIPDSLLTLLAKIGKKPN